MESLAPNTKFYCLFNSTWQYCPSGQTHCTDQSQHCPVFYPLTGLHYNWAQGPTQKLTSNTQPLSSALPEVSIFHSNNHVIFRTTKDSIAETTFGQRSFPLQKTQNPPPVSASCCMVTWGQLGSPNDDREVLLPHKTAAWAVLTAEVNSYRKEARSHLKGFSWKRAGRGVENKQSHASVVNIARSLEKKNTKIWGKSSETALQSCYFPEFRHLLPTWLPQVKTDQTSP